MPFVKENRTSSDSFRVLGVAIRAIQIPEVIDEMRRWIRARDGCHFIAVTGMHGVTEAQHDPAFRQVLNSADLVVPDGMPLVWIGRMKGFDLRRRVYGPELLDRFCSSTNSQGIRHFLFGAGPGVAEQLAANLKARYPGLHVVGVYSPPFRALTADENEQVARMIRCAAPDVVWVGLSTPKQEQWMFQNRSRLPVPVLVGVGAAFDIHAGVKKQAPLWMRDRGLEWLFRLCSEPGRLWKRYLVYGSEFVFRVTLEMLKIARSREPETLR
jgi:N-acetylglucosaminyldiphosphoundecaprenol N-acetyl-beta-D-mannosaminyltransferase